MLIWASINFLLAALNLFSFLVMKSKFRYVNLAMVPLCTFAAIMDIWNPT